ncbi:MAG: ubiquinol-cytochrome c reductase iron-sulfur subunit [Thermodesulfobacteriota bacterium]
MGLLKRIFGICETKPPADPGCWDHRDGKVTIDLRRTPELNPPHGAIRLEGRGLPDRLMIYHDPRGGYTAIKNKCTHMGRRIDPLAGTDNFRCCSVSKTTYSSKGDVLSGPGKEPLTLLRLEVMDQRLVVSTR